MSKQVWEQVEVTTNCPEWACACGSPECNDGRNLYMESEDVIGIWADNGATDITIHLPDDIRLCRLVPAPEPKQGAYPINLTKAQTAHIHATRHEHVCEMCNSIQQSIDEGVMSDPETAAGDENLKIVVQAIAVALPLAQTAEERAELLGALSTLSPEPAAGERGWRDFYNEVMRRAEQEDDAAVYADRIAYHLDIVAEEWGKEGESNG